MSEDNDIRTCGCLEGQFGLLLGLVVFGLLFLLGKSTLPTAGWGQTGIAFALALAGAVLGKAIGVARVAWRPKR